MQSNQKSIVIVSRHYFSKSRRKTTVHFYAREFAKLGYKVFFITAGRSLISSVITGGSQSVPSDISRSNFNEIEPNIFSITLNEFIHPVSSGNRFIGALTSPDLFLYGKRLKPSLIKSKIQDANIVLIECGYGLAYFPAFQKICPNAKMVYFATDPLSQVGLRQEFEVIEKKYAPQFDFVRVADESLADRFEYKENVIVIPQGVDKDAFDNSGPSPYKKDTINAISIGDMAFDYDAARILIKSFPEIQFHFFGVSKEVSSAHNCFNYGETDFDELVPYIKHADIGLMLYQMHAGLHYLSKTSLKLLQYSYCKLPVMAPNGPDWVMSDVYTYNNNDVCFVMKESLQSTNLENQEILSWSDCIKILNKIIIK
jgi:2-beta-glucuronyltransferase